MATKKYFGTDGIRGRVGESLVNPEFVLKLGWAAGKVLGSGTNGSAKVLIGKDTRISGYLLESVLEAGLSSAGVDTFLLGPMPTPAIAYLTRTLRANGGIVISASHNSYHDNGIKFFSSLGVKISDEIEHAIEAYLEKPLEMVSADKLGKAKRINDAAGRYIEFCKSTMGLNSSLSGLKIVVDCAHGATYHVAPDVLRELGAEVVEISTSPDGFNINANCGSTNPDLLVKMVLAEGADIGVAFDGDGDRVIMVDHKGEVVNGDEILFIMAKQGFSNGSLCGGVVGTLMSNLGLEQSLKQLGIEFKRSNVGDRHVIDALYANKWLLGGESSGHIVHLGLTTTGDGIVSALQVLNSVCCTGKTLNELKSAMLRYPQILINVTKNGHLDIQNNTVIQNALKAAEQKLGNSGRVLLRSSGTESVIRVMVEGLDMAQITVVANELADTVRQCTIPT